jgi:hypothetical protein
MVEAVLFLYLCVGALLSAFSYAEAGWPEGARWPAVAVAALTIMVAWPLAYLPYKE